LSKNGLLPNLSESYATAIARNRATGWGDLSPAAKLFCIEYSKEGDLAAASKRAGASIALGRRALANPLVIAYIGSLIGDEASESVINREFLEFHMLSTLEQVNGDVDVSLMFSNGPAVGRHYDASTKIRLLKQMQDFLEVRAPQKSSTLLSDRVIFGEPRKFNSPDELWTACAEYFAWVEDNPIFEVRVEVKLGKECEIRTPRPRMPSERAMILFVGSRSDDWKLMAADDKFRPIIEMAREVILDIKMSNASANTVNPNFIARDIGLVESFSQEHVGAGGGPIRMIVTGMTPQQAAEAYAETLRSG
jgi:hypothetical protein